MAGWRWVRLDVDYFRNPKVLAAGHDAHEMHLASICWVGQYLTDGAIPSSAVKAIAADADLDGRTKARAVDALVAAGLWTPEPDGFELHDYVAMNGTRAEVERERDQWRERQRRYRSKGNGGP